MDFGIKVSKPGYDVTKGNDVRGKTTEKPDPNLLYSLATPYVMGANVQVGRYKQWAATLKDNPILGCQACLHETSCLFEDLATISKYTELCGHSHERDQLWRDVRNHIRHDTREEFDNETDKRKIAKAQRLGIDERLQTNIGFSESAIKIGTTVIQLTDIEKYIFWAAGIINQAINEARANGQLTETPLEGTIPLTAHVTHPDVTEPEKLNSPDSYK